MTQVETKNFDAKQWYLSNFDLFEENLNGTKDIPFHATRKSAISKFAEMGFPSQRDEEWKYTSVAPILRQKFNHITQAESVPKASISEFAFEGLDSSLLVFVNGHFSAQLSTFEAKAAGVIVGSLRTLILEQSDLLLQYLGQFASFEAESFTALNTAFTEDGAFIYIPSDTIVEQPVHLLNLSIGQDGPFISHPRKLVVVGPGSELQFVESFHSLSNDVYFNNQVSEVVVQENAKVHHIKIQEESLNAFHVANSQVQQERHSVYSSVNIDLGSALTRNNLNIRLNAENCESHLFGFYHGQGTQHIDSHTFIDHAKPHCFSNELYKGILDGKANAVFSGKIVVRQDAQKTNALQSNKTLLLTDEASINAKPQLEIFADDVKCTHGATIGQLDDEALFYLRARGIGQDVASALLRYAFAGDIFENIGIESVRKKLDEKILRRLTGVNEV